MLKRRQTGFSLLELMITVAIVGILASIAYPSYRQSIMRSNRTDAKVALSQYASDLEKCYTQYFKYNDTVVGHCQRAIDFNGGATLNVAPNNYYKVGATTLTATTYTLTATPLGAQANDTKCGNLTLTQDNVKGISGTGTVSSCW